MNIFSAGYFYYEQNLAKETKAKSDINVINEDDDNNILDNKKDNLISDDIKNDANDKKIVKNISVVRLCSEDNKDENISDTYVRDSSSFFLEVKDIKEEERIKEPKKKEIKSAKYNGYYISYLFTFFFNSNYCKTIFKHRRYHNRSQIFIY